MSLPKFLHGQFNGLPNTLAKRVSYIRNHRGIHIQELSMKARVSIDFLESVESGIETWLSTSIRQRIARVLKVDPNILEEVELKKTLTEINYEITEEETLKIKNNIMQKKENLCCPLCNSKLKSWIQEGYDLIGNSVFSPKAHCTKCLFQLRG